MNTAFVVLGGGRDAPCLFTGYALSVAGSIVQSEHREDVPMAATEQDAEIGVVWFGMLSAYKRASGTASMFRSTQQGQRIGCFTMGIRLAKEAATLPRSGGPSFTCHQKMSCRYSEKRVPKSQTATFFRDLTTVSTVFFPYGGATCVLAVCRISGLGDAPGTCFPLRREGFACRPARNSVLPPLLNYYYYYYYYYFYESQWHLSASLLLALRHGLKILKKQLLGKRT